MNNKFRLTAAALLFCNAAFAQPQSGKVMYEETIRMDVRLEGDAAQFAHMLPKERKTMHVLHFTPEASLFQPVAEGRAKDEETVASSGGPRMVIRTEAPQEKFYTDLKTGESVESRDFMGRKFLVTGSVEKAPWKMTGNQKTILDYPCQEAVMIRDRDTTTAWFTTAIPVSTGPHGWNGLPGLILAAQRNSNVIITALSLSPGAVAEGVIVKPKGGRKVTREEFRAVVDAKMKEMGGERDGNGNQVIIKVRGN